MNALLADAKVISQMREKWFDIEVNNRKILNRIVSSCLSTETTRSRDFLIDLNDKRKLKILK